MIIAVLVSAKQLREIENRESVMLNFLWGGMLLAGIIYAAFTGNIQTVSDAALSSAKDAVSICIAMVGILAFWVGLMRIAENAGIIRAAAAKMEPLLGFLFPGVPRGSRAREYIAINCICNLFGLGWAATPAGLKAMEELKKLSKDRRASSAMCTFLVLNISSLQLIPITIIGYRGEYGSVDPSVIVGPAIAATCISTLAGIVFSRVMTAVDQKRQRKTVSGRRGG